MAERMILIRDVSSGIGFDIIVDPAPEWANHNASRPTRRDAMRYAASLKTVHGWKVADQSGGGDEQP